MEFTLDLHTHTVASGHAYSTVQEMAKAAADKAVSYTHQTLPTIA